MSDLQRNNSFQAHDDDPAYHPLNSSGDSPRPRSMAENSQPFTSDNLARLDGRGSPSSGDPAEHLGGHPAHSTDRALHPVPSVPEVSSLGPPGGGYRHGAEDGNGRSREGPNNEGKNNIKTNDAVLPHSKPSENNPRLTPAGVYREDERYWGPGVGYARSDRRSGYFAGDQYDNLNSSQRGLVTPGSSSSPLYSPSASSPSSQAPLISGTPAPVPPAHGLGALENRSSDRVLSTPVGGHYTDNPYNRYSTTWDPVLSSTQVQVDGNPDTYVLSDEEEETHRRGAAGAAATGAAGGGVLAALGSKVGRPAPSHIGGAAGGAGAGVGGSGVVERGGLLGGSDGGSGNLNNGKAEILTLGNTKPQSLILMAGGNNAEKVAQSEWLRSQTKSKKKLRWVIGVILILFILGAAGGISAGVVLSKKSSKGSSGGATSEANGGGGSGLSGAEDTRQNGDLNKDSPEIKTLMSNARFKKIFHGMDYTPLNAVYPDCTSRGLL